MQRVFHAPLRLSEWPDTDRRTRIVFITRDWADAEITAAFAELP
jgi:hypothetical protein